MDGTRGLKALENWAKKVTDGYNGVNVKDMSSSFRDGLAFCAIIHHYHPQLIDYASLSKENILHNNSLAFTVAETQLGVPALLDAEDMVSFNVPDRLSIITYLSQLHNCFENQNKFNRVRPAVKRVLNDEQPSPFLKSPLSESKNSIPRSHEICQKCKHRVFILERLIVSSKLYHRTCFRCSKCDAILNPGAYTESDSSGAFECILCPRDDKKEKAESSVLQQKPVVSEEIINSAELSGEKSLGSSPLPTQDSPKLSSNFVKARKDFLEKSIKEKSDDEEMNSSSSESLSSCSEPEDLDSGFKDESLSEDISNKLSQASSMQNEKLNNKKQVQLTPLKSFQRNDSKEPYQSIFSREIYSISSLKPSSHNTTSPKSPSRPKSPLGFTYRASQNIAGSEIPVIRSSITSPTSLLKPYDFSSLNLKEKEKKPFRRNSLEEKKNSAEDSQIEILDTNSNKALSSDNIRIRNHEHSEYNNESRMSVKQMILLREASMEDSKKSFSTYNNGNSTPVDLQNKTPSLKIEESVKTDIPTELTLNHSGNEDNQEDSTPEIELPETCKEDIQVNIIPEIEPSVPETCEEDIQVNTTEIEPLKPSEPECESEKNVTCSDEILSTDHDIPEIEKNELKALSVPVVEIKDDETVEYPDDLNPFGDDEEEEEKKNDVGAIKSPLYPTSLNPFGDDDDEEEVALGMPPGTRSNKDYDESLNPFADSDDGAEEHHLPTKTPPPRPPLPTVLNKSPFNQDKSLTKSPSNSISGSTKKRKAPKPPPPHVKELFLDTSGRSDNSLSVSPSPVKSSPSPKVFRNKPRVAPPPPPNMAKGQESKKPSDEISNASTATVSPGADRKSISSTDSSGSQWKKKKRPAPSVPVATRREIKKIPISEINREMKDIEQKQIELENHGRELEELIRVRDKDVDPTVEEEECILQLFELVNEKNVLFRRQAELMHIKRSQRLEEDQVELEFRIRTLMIKPVSKKTDEDKAREEKLIQQLIEVVEQRNEIISSIEMDRRREAGEDESVLEQMEQKAGDLPITAELKEKKKKKKKKKSKEEKQQKLKEKLDPDQKKFTLKRKWF